MHDVFISYSKHDRARVERLVPALEARGWTVFWDRHLLGGDRWPEQIATELAAARCVVVAWSPRAVASGWVRDEATRADERGVLVPVVVDPVAIPLGFGQLQTIAVMDAAGEPDAEGVQQLLASVDRFVRAARDGASTRPAQAAVDAEPDRRPPPGPVQAPRRRASDAPRRGIGAALGRLAMLIVLPLLTVSSVGAYALALDDPAMAWMFVVLGAAVAAVLYWWLGRDRIDNRRLSPALLTATVMPAAMIVGTVVALFFGPVAVRVPYALFAAVLGGSLAAAAVTRCGTDRTVPTPRFACDVVAGSLTWFAVAFLFSTVIEEDVSRRFANGDGAAFAFSRPFLHAEYVHALRVWTRDVDAMWLIAAFLMAAGVVHALRTGLEHEGQDETGVRDAAGGTTAGR